MNRKRNRDLENGSLEDFEMRVADLEDDMKIFKTVLIQDKEKNIHTTKRIKSLE